MGKKEYDKAVGDYNRIIELASNPHWSAYYKRGYAYEGLGKKTEAISDFEVVLRSSKNTQIIESAKEKIAELRTH